MIKKSFSRRLKFYTGSNNVIASVLLISGGGKFSCLFRKGNYRALECYVKTNIEERKDILKK